MIPVSVGGQPFVLTQHITALLQGGHDRRIGRRASDAVLFQGAHQAGFGKTRRRLGEVLLRQQADQFLRLALFQVGRDTCLRLFFLFLILILGFFINDQKTLEKHGRARGAQQVCVQALSAR